jgi:hypothetical protein
MLKMLVNGEKMLYFYFKIRTLGQSMKNNIQFRWIWILLIILLTTWIVPSVGISQAVDDYRAVATGNWSAIATWQRFDGTSWVAAVATPTSANGVITIQAPFIVTRNAALTVDQVIIDPGATILSSAASILTIANGAGVDLTINGTFIESTNAVNQMVWIAGATWQMGANGTLIKTTATSSNNWQTTYQGGITNIPASANWIIRRNTAVNVSLSTTSPASGSVYPNLTIENNVAGTWVTPAASGFTGNTIYPTIKGNLDIGGAGTSTVSFLNDVQNATTTQVLGNVTVKVGNTLRNYGTGLEIKGNLTVNGTLDYTAGTGARRIIFSGALAQSISGTGTLNVYILTLNKTANEVTLNRAVTVDNVMTFTNGLINTTATNLLTINTAGSVTGTSNASFVKGPVRYVGGSAFTYPVGKGTDYQPLSISSTAVGGTFWTETFSNGCASGCLASAYSGPNGAWTVTTANPDAGCGPPDYPNVWYVSGAECGNAAGACGSVCGAADPSLHVGSTSILDPGAAYDAGGYCPLLGWPGTQSDTRCESPTINCAGYSNITLAFNYIENGSGTNDNATLWYFDGTSWAQLVDLAKTPFGSCSPQGWWTAYSTVLPASANNNPSIKIGFKWINDDDGAGSDPSFAVDDITLGITGPTVDFTCEYFYANPQITFNNVLSAGLTSISNCEYWILTRNAGTTSKSVTLSWDANSCGFVTNLTDLRVARWDGAIWQDHGNGGTTGNTTAGTIVTSAAVSSFSPFTLALNSTPLPVELLSFTAAYNGIDVDLKWATATETNSDYFSVERSIDAVDFAEIGKIAASGNSNSILEYSSRDQFPMEGLSYYRLKEVDFDGEFQYSGVVPININIDNDKNNLLEILNLSSGNGLLNFTFNCVCKTSLNIRIIDATGRNVFLNTDHPMENGNVFSTDISSFSPGIYMIILSDGQNIKSQKFVRL